ncbi:hydantoinase B/oxoprolinase family protein [Streptomyces sp. NPDC056309]|uniref:hydantoinase B/oxoprolinase family protein n=1 Tax=unclassified Streptomyces TaxID=2593676 RepID=UPI0035DF3BED
MPWNEGLLRPVEISVPDGLVCTAVPPAPVGSATVEAVWTVSIVVSAALNRLPFASPKYAHRAQAVSSGTMATFNLSGRDRPGKVFGLHLTDPLAGGFGVFADHDGQNAAGPINAPCPSIADVEVNEQKAPLFYRYRRLAPGTGGAGRRRGGLGAEVGVTVAAPKAEALVMTHGVEVPNSVGLGGGLPGAMISRRFRAGEGQPRDLGPKPGSFPITPADLFEVTWQGGGGIGEQTKNLLEPLHAGNLRHSLSVPAATCWMDWLPPIARLCAWCAERASKHSLHQKHAPMRADGVKAQMILACGCVLRSGP